MSRIIALSEAARGSQGLTAVFSDDELCRFFFVYFRT